MDRRVYFHTIDLRLTRQRMLSGSSRCFTQGARQPCSFSRYRFACGVLLCAVLHVACLRMVGCWVPASFLIVCGVWQLHMYLAIPYFLYRLNPNFDFEVDLEFSHRKMSYHLLLLIVAFVWSTYEVAKDRTVVAPSDNKFRTDQDTTGFSLIQLILATLQRYAFLCLLMFFMQFGAPLFKDFQCEILQDTETQYYCQWPPCNLKDGSTTEYTRTVVNRCNQDMLASSGSNASNWNSFNTSTCDETISRDCYRCRDWNTIPEVLGLQPSTHSLTQPLS